jgi:hypothetical protein
MLAISVGGRNTTEDFDDPILFDIDEAQDLHNLIVYFSRINCPSGGPDGLCSQPKTSLV